MGKLFFLNQSAVTEEFHSQLRNSFRNIKREKGYSKPPFNQPNSNNRCNERNGWKPKTYFRCGSEDHFITKFQEPDTSDEKVHWNTENPKTHTYRLTKIDKMSDNSTDESESQKIYKSMARMSTNAESPIRNYGIISQLTNCILGLGVTCHMTPDI